MSNWLFTSLLIRILPLVCCSAEAWAAVPSFNTRDCDRYLLAHTPISERSLVVAAGEKAFSAAEVLWNLELESAKSSFRPRIVFFHTYVETPCGTRLRSHGPCFCPANFTIYVDPLYFIVKQLEFGVPTEAFVGFVISHEFGHFIQWQVYSTVAWFRVRKNKGLSSLMELQANCLAGWLLRTQLTDEAKDDVLTRAALSGGEPAVEALKRGLMAGSYKDCEWPELPPLTLAVRRRVLWPLW
jgi:hypothetical protein